MILLRILNSEFLINNYATSFFQIYETKREFLFVSRIICTYDVCIGIQLLIKFVQVFRIVYYSFCNTNHSLFFWNIPTWVFALQ